MTNAIDTFIYLQRDLEQSFQRVQTIFNSLHYDRQEVDQIFNHISCTLDDLEKVNQLINSSSSSESSSVNITSSQNPSVLLNLSENDFDTDNLNNEISIENSTEKTPIVTYSKENEERLIKQHLHTTNNFQPTINEREEFIHRMKQQHDYYKNKIESLRKENQMEIIQLDQAPDDDHIIRQQDQQLENMHHSIVSLKNLTQNINFEIDDHIRVIDDLETDMIDNQNRVENLTHHTKYFIRTSGDVGVGGHTCLFAIAVGLFFLIVILIIFF